MDDSESGIPEEGTPKTSEPIDAAKLLLDSPLYDTFGYGSAAELYYVEAVLKGQARMDGHCPYCQRASTFASSRTLKENPYEAAFMPTDPTVTHAILKCARDQRHSLNFWLFFADASVRKIGQWPSFADIANDQAKQYSKVLEKEDGQEFHTAISLAAHGVGIGAFVYLRRVIERLVGRTFDRHKGELGLDDEQFQRLQFAKKIDALKDFLPDFLVGNRHIYGLLSLGIHELDEERCLAAFSVMRAAIIEILEDDKQAREKAERRVAAERELNKLNSTTSKRTPRT